MRRHLPTRLVNLAIATVLSLLVVGVFSTNAKADQWNQLTKVTFSGPVEIPGFHGPMVLAPGTYVFKLLDVSGSRNVVQIFNEDQTHLYTTILAISNYRLTPTGETVITFAERPADTPPAVKAWFYPGRAEGHEFVYPKPQAVELAREANEPVLSMPEEEASNLAQPIKSAEEPAVKALEKAPVVAEEPSGREEAESAVVQPEEQAANTLPRTASEMPLVALGGILLFGLGVGFRLASRKAA